MIDISRKSILYPALIVAACIGAAEQVALVRWADPALFRHPSSTAVINLRDLTPQKLRTDEKLLTFFVLDGKGK